MMQRPAVFPRHARHLSKAVPGSNVRVSADDLHQHGCVPELEA